MAITLDVHNIFPLGINGGTSSALDTTAANLIVAAVMSNTGGTPVFSDNQGNSYDSVTTITGTYARMELYYKINPTVNASHTWAVSGNGTYATVGVVCMAGVASFDAGVRATNTTDPLSLGSITPAENDEALICFYANDWITSGTPTVDAGFTLLDYVQTVGGVTYDLASAYQIQTTATTRNPQWDWTDGAFSYMGQHVAFKASGGGGGSPSKRRLLLHLGL